MTRETLEFDAHHPDQIVLSPSQPKADGSIDITMGNRHGNTLTRTEEDDAVGWKAHRNETMSSQVRMFDWENHLNDDSTLESVFEYVVEVAMEKGLTLDDITVTPKSVVSQSDRALLVHMWAKSLDDYVEKSCRNRNRKLVEHVKQLMAAHMSSGEANHDTSRPSNARKRMRSDDESENNDSCCSSIRGFRDMSRAKVKNTQRNKDPKSKFIERSSKIATSRRQACSEISLSTSSGSNLSEADSNGFRSGLQKKNGAVIIDVEKSFAANFPSVMVNIIRTNLCRGSRTKGSNAYLAYGVKKCSQEVIPSGECAFGPRSLAPTTENAASYGSHWHPSKMHARLAFMWYCLYAHSDEQWRTKWLLYLIGDGNKQVEVHRKRFDQDDSTFTLSIDDVIGM